ncbi:MAG TPA: RHS repeat-associated core domain-containing protein [Phycisphaerae bacterium]|nr:RHS repeat-associated core domain-containing protein [Phycisphaerae bacterium]
MNAVRLGFLLLSFASLCSLCAPEASAMYHPSAGRWMQRDPAGYADGPNQYSYVAASPPTKTDCAGQDGTSTAVPSNLATALNAAPELQWHPADPFNTPLNVAKAVEALKAAGAQHFSLGKTTRSGRFQFVFAVGEVPGGKGGCQMEFSFELSSFKRGCCRKLAILQFIRNVTDGNYYFIGDHQDREARIAADGWYVDTWRTSPNDPYVSHSNTSSIMFDDQPQGQLSTQPGLESGQTLVTCVACLEGWDKDLAYGCIRWGWQYMKSRRRIGVPGPPDVWNHIGPEFVAEVADKHMDVIRNWNTTQGTQPITVE